MLVQSGYSKNRDAAAAVAETTEGWHDLRPSPGVVDDSSLVREHLMLALRREGHDVVEAVAGQDAAEKLWTLPGSGWCSATSTCRT
jgi:PleD family two-component response regulator